MKATLIKENDFYYLVKDNKIIAEINGHPLKSITGKLSKQNCDEIFRVTDVEKLARNCIKHRYNKYGENITSETQKLDTIYGFKEGFNKAIELNKDKVFTLEDMLNAYMEGTNDGAQFESLMDYDSEDFDEAHEFAKEAEREFIQSLQQPTEIEVEIEMETCSMNPLDLDCDEIIEKTKLDSEGCLILKKIEQ
jgi:hypothetical protein